jgi:hypothetical protein
MNRSTLCMVCLAIATALPASACYVEAGPPVVEGEVVAAPPPPPAPVVEVAPAPPSPEMYWVAGYHRWYGGRYVWVRGHYERRPHPTARWEAAHWEPRAHGSVWIEGRWR